MFRAALETGALPAVAGSLALAAAIVRDDQMHSLLLNPKVSAQQKKEIFDAAAGGRFDEITKRTLSILVDGHREVLIGSIAEQFEELKHNHEKLLPPPLTTPH